MKLHKACKVELATHDDACRLVLTEAYLDISHRHKLADGTDGLIIHQSDTIHSSDCPREGRVVSCDGRILAVVPVELNEHDRAGWISEEVLRAARKDRRTDEPEIILNGKAELANGTTMNRSDAIVDPSGSVYPNWRQIVPEFEKGKSTSVSFDVELLWKLTQALGVKAVTLTFDDPTSAILVKPTDLGDIKVKSKG